MQRDSGDTTSSQYLLRAITALALGSALAYVALASQLPMAILSGAGHDDAWFWQRAQAIAGGSWLGRYDEFTLMKGSGYPLFLAVVHQLGLPLATAQALLYAGACLLLGNALHRATGRPWLALLVVVALHWHPAAMAWTRVLRDSISSAQALLVLACILQAGWGGHRPRAALAWATLGGLALGWFWTTREDGIWLLPGVAVLLLAPVAWAWRDPARRRAHLVAGAAVVLACLAWLGLVSTANGAKYGDFATVDVKGAAFSDAMAALQGVRAGPIVPYVPVPRAAREEIYRVSPAFARLRPALESPDNVWTGPGCSLYPQACGDYAGGWFLWALREAVASVEGYRTAATAAAFYRDITREVGQACADGRLACTRPLVPLMPAVGTEQWRSLPGRLRAAASLLAWQDVRELPHRSHLDLGATEQMWRFVGRPRVPDDPALLGGRAVGWLRDPDGGWLQARCGDQVHPIQRQPSPDVAAHLGDPTLVEQRFAFALPAGPSCRLELLSGDRALDLAGVHRTPARFELGDAELYLDTLHAIPPSAVAPAWALRAKAMSWQAYAWLLPWLGSAGLLGFAVALVRALARRHAGPLLVLATTCWGLVLARALVLVLVDLSAFPAINHSYMQAAFPLLVLAAIASLAAVPGRPARG